MNTLVGSKSDVSASVADDGNKFGDSELVTAVGMRTDGCSVTGCMRDAIEAVEG